MPSDRYLNWEQLAVMKLKEQWKSAPLMMPLEVRYEFHFKNRQHEPDVSNCIEGPQDALQKAGVIKNDKQIMKIIGLKRVNMPEECVLIEVREFV